MSRDDVLEQELSRALAPWVGKLPDDVLAALREELAAYAMTHPVGARMFERAVPPPVVDQSGDVPVEGADGAEDADAEGAAPGKAR